MEFENMKNEDDKLEDTELSQDGKNQINLLEIIRQNREILRRQRNLEDAIVKIRQNTNTSVDAYDTMCQVFTALGDMRTELTKVVKSLNVSAKPTLKTPHNIARENMASHSAGILPELGESIKRKLDTCQKFKRSERFYKPQEEIDFKSQESFDKMKRFFCPQMFTFFVGKFLENPANCTFHKKGDRGFMCLTNNDTWEKSERLGDFWNTVRLYLWRAYVRYVEKISENNICDKDFVDGILGKLDDISENKIPVNKAALIHILYRTEQGFDDSPRIAELLSNAYRSRNKRH